ncbi:MAG: HAD family phosphatase [Clostridiales bacterium]|nr:HAD family phosphatase [Clostridiales bacterium]
MIKNVILDMGNVLLDYNPPRAMELLNINPECREIMLNEMFNSPEWEMCDRGIIDDEGMYDRVKVRVPEKYHADLKKCVDNWHICMTPLEGAVDFIKKAKKKYPLYLLSNASNTFHTYFPKAIDPSDFKGLVVSSDIKMGKPDHEIYEYLLNKYSLKAEECIFIDDRLPNIKAAEELGFNTFQFKEDFAPILKLLDL